MKIRLLVLSSMSLVVLAAVLWQSSKPVDSQSAPKSSPTSLFAFRNNADSIPSGWTGPTFKLSHSYPKQQPKCEAPWLKRQVDFNNQNSKWSDWEGYVKDIMKYAFEQQDGNLPDNIGWNTQVNGQTRWYHIPWMAYDPHGGREFVHGLTNELSTALTTFLNNPASGRASGKATLAGTKPVNGAIPLFETWSVGMYNPCGAYAIGQAFPETGAPATYKDSKTGQLLAKGLPFPEGTVVIKILNSTADPNLVPYLKSSTSWQANGHLKLAKVPTQSSDYATYDRAITTVHLVQIDLAVVDSRSPTRWVYSTLGYDDKSSGKTVLDRMVPLGVQWGSDPQSYPGVPQAQSKPVWQSVLAPINIPEHYGCNKRLAGVLDNPASSCVSCHMGSYAAAPGVLDAQGTNIPLIFVPTSTCQTYSPTSKSYFSNYKYPMPYPDSTGLIKAAIPLDSSLQLQVAFAQYAKFVNGMP